MFSFVPTNTGFYNLGNKHQIGDTGNKYQIGNN